MKNVLERIGSAEEFLAVAGKNSIEIDPEVVAVLPMVNFEGESLKGGDIAILSDTTLGAEADGPIKVFDAIREAKALGYGLLRPKEALEVLLMQCEETEMNKLVALMYPIGNNGNRALFMLVKRGDGYAIKLFHTVPGEIKEADFIARR